MAAHGAVVHAGLTEEQHHNDSEQRIEIKWNCTNEQIETAVILHNAGDGSCPRGNGGDHADGGGSSIDEIGELGAGNMVTIGNGTHDTADSQTVKVVVYKDENTQQEGGKHGAAAGLDVCLCPCAEGCGAACLIEQGDKDTEQHEEHEDTGVIADGNNDTVIQQRVECLYMEAGVEQSTGNGADKERAVNFLGDECQRNSDDGGNERPECTEHNIYLLKNETKKAMRYAENKSHGK